MWIVNESPRSMPRVQNEIRSATVTCPMMLAITKCPKVACAHRQGATDNWRLKQNIPPRGRPVQRSRSRSQCFDPGMAGAIKYTIRPHNHLELCGDPAAAMKRSQPMIKIIAIAARRPQTLRPCGTAWCTELLPPVNPCHCEARQSSRSPRRWSTSFMMLL